MTSSVDESNRTPFFLIWCACHVPCHALHCEEGFLLEGNGAKLPQFFAVTRPPTLSYSPRAHRRRQFSQLERRFVVTTRLRLQLSNLPPPCSSNTWMLCYALGRLLRPLSAHRVRITRRADGGDGEGRPRRGPLHDRYRPWRHGWMMATGRYTFGFW